MKAILVKVYSNIVYELKLIHGNKKMEVEENVI